MTSCRHTCGLKPRESTTHRHLLCIWAHWWPATSCALRRSGWREVVLTIAEHHWDLDSAAVLRQGLVHLARQEPDRVRRLPQTLHEHGLVPKGQTLPCPRCACATRAVHSHGVLGGGRCPTVLTEGKGRLVAC